MLMIAIIGAVISGIIMWVGNSAYKQGKPWGQLVAIIFGVLAIGMGLWAVALNVTGGGNAGAVSKEIGYQRARAEKVGQYVAQNFKDKKILILTMGDYKDNNGKVIENHLLTGLQKGLGGINAEILRRPVPEEGSDEAMEEMEWRQKHLDNLLQGKDAKGKDIPGYSPVGDFDLVITTIGLPEDAIRGGKPTGKLAGKSIAIVQGYTEKWAGAFKTKAIVVAAIDKQYPGEGNAAGLKEWEQNPPADLDKAFNVRYTLKTN
ncbi:MAG: hypothetical protein J6X49_16260 [Victivallales bacterium]|nr:hypothetical protein [Victivallales bacterium]